MTDRQEPPASVLEQDPSARAGSGAIAVDARGAVDVTAGRHAAQERVPTPSNDTQAPVPAAYGQAPVEPDLAQPHPVDALPQQAQRLEALGQLTAGLAHEFNNLLTIVLANLQRLAQEQDPDRRAGQVARADWGAQRAARLTGQMLSLARRGFDEAQVVDVNATVRDCDAILDQMAGRHLSVVLDLADGTLPVRLDPVQLELVLLNLVRNAADASAPGQRIVVRSRRCRSEDGEAVRMAVIDDGAGMTDQVRAQATQPFFTTKQPGRGTGLGLSMVKDFAAHCGGRLEIRSAPGCGTTIDLVLPLAADDAGGSLSA